MRPFCFKRFVINAEPYTAFRYVILTKEESTATERIFAHAGANAEDISVAVGRAKGLPYDGDKEIEAYEYGLEQRKAGNGENLDLLIDATDYLDRTGDSGIMEGEDAEDVYNNETIKVNFNIPDDKIDKFCLKPGSKHANEFFGVGYETTDSGLLKADILSQITNEIVDVKVNEKGVERFSIFMTLGKTKKKRFRTVWQKDNPDSKPRFITAHREDGDTDEGK